ncbi:MAG: hypothetical protein HY824_02345 [Acidobacteria bacterium]|nr:hypothetical protein [Acidobacteriota bacterium]
MLFFELFPAFVAVVSLVIGIALFVANRRAPAERPRAGTARRPTPDAAPTPDAPPTTRRTRWVRPSMRA